MTHPSTVADTLDAGDGWIAWTGGVTPPADWDGGAVRFRDGIVSDLYSSGWDWGHNPTDPAHVRAVEIIAYRAVQP